MKKIVALMLALCFVLSASSALACTGLYVGKDASADGTYLIAHTVDWSNSAQAGVYAVPGVYNEPGRVFVAAEGKEFPLPDTTWAYTTNPYARAGRTYAHSMDGTTSNEKGVSCTGAVTCYTTDEINALDPLIGRAQGGGGLSESFLCQLVAMCASTAREGVEVLGKYIDMFGNAENNTVMIADQNEAWYIEYYTGHQWCAVKMPDDCVAVFGNMFMLGAVDVNSEDVICSEGLVSVPQEAGLAVFTEDGLIDLFATYSGGNANNDYRNILRNWYGHKMLAPSTAGEYNLEDRGELFYQPDEPVTLKQAFEVTRARFEGTPYCPDENDDVTWMRVIGVEVQLNIGIAQIYPDLPPEMAIVTWTSNSNAEHGVYLPVSNLITDTAESFKYLPPKMGMDENLAHYHFKRLAALAEQNRHLYGEGVRAYWSQMEDQLIADMPGILDQMKALLDQDKAAAQEFITNYTIDLQNKAVEDADTMFNELFWYMIVNTSTKVDPATVKPYTPSIMPVEEPADNAA